MADFLPADHFKEEVSSRKHTKGPSHKDADWDFLKGAGPSAPDVRSDVVLLADAAEFDKACSAAWWSHNNN